MAVSAGNARDIRAGGAYVELSANDKSLQKGLTAAKNRLQKFSADIGALGATLTKVGAGIVAPLAVATSQYANLSDKLLVVRSRTKATDDEFNSMRQRVSELTRTTTFSATEIAEGMISLASMGMNPAQINALIESMLNLSRATGTELGNATTIAMNNLNVFQASVSEAQNYVDILTKTSNGSAQILSDLGEALNMSAQSAKSAGVDFQSLNAILAVLANNGQRGTLAGTGMRNVFLSFVKNADKFDEYGIKIQDAQHNLRAIPDIFDDINKKASELPQMERMTMFSELFGTRGLNSANILSENTAALRQFTSELDNAGGDARKTATLMDSDIGGALRRIGNSFKGLSGEVGKAISEYITPIIGNIAKIINNTTDWVSRNHALIVTIGKIGGGLIAAGVALIALSKTILLLKFGLVGLQGLLTLIIGSMTALSALAFANPFTIIMTGVAACVAALMTMDGTFSQLFDTIKKGFSAVVDDTAENVQNLKYVIINGRLEDAFKVAVLSIKIIWHDLFDDLIAYWKTFESYIAKGIAWIFSKFDKNLDFDFMAAEIDKEIENDVMAFRTAKAEYQKEINDIIEGIKATQANRPDGETSVAVDGGTLGAKTKSLFDSIQKLLDASKEAEEKIVYSNPTFGSFSLDAINLGSPRYDVEKRMLDELKKIEKNTRDDDDDNDGAVQVF